MTKYFMYTIAMLTLQGLIEYVSMQLQSIKFRMTNCILLRNLFLYDHNITCIRFLRFLHYSVTFSIIEFFHRDTENKAINNIIVILIYDLDKSD